MAHWTRMAKNLLIVESPAKAKTINKYLGKDFQVLASYGHVRDLVPKEGAVDPERDFAMRYELIDRNEKHVDAIAKAAKGADALFLATDPDREGEAISWHIAEVLRERGLLKDRSLQRVVFTEITPRAIKEAMSHPRAVSENRPYLIWKVTFTKPKLGEMDTELFKEWFQAFAQNAGLTLHIENLYGENNHHIVESCFKGLARALRQAIAIDPRKQDAVPSTKGVL